MTKKELIENYVLDNINNGVWKEGKRILSEADISEKLKCSRNTVREALINLENKGVVERKHGSGTYVKNKKESKYIVLLMYNYYRNEELFYVYQRLAGILQDMITEKGYKIIFYVETVGTSFFDCMKIEPKKIVCFICINRIYHIYDTVKNKIPVISAFGINQNFCYNVNINATQMFSIFENLINKYEFENPIIFIHEPAHNNFESQNVFLYGLYYVISQKYRTVRISEEASFQERRNKVKEILDNIHNETDCIVFSDDTFFKSVIPYIPEFIEKHPDIKIITHTNKPDNMMNDFSVCKVSLDLNVFAKKILDLAEKLINKDYISNVNIFCSLTVENENYLKRKG